MPTATPSFESRQYWESHFAKCPQSSDWLVSPSVLIPPLFAALSPDAPGRTTTLPSILHIGCGTSDLSNMLRRHVPPDSITNVDFSHQAIQLGIQRELEEFTDVRAGDRTGSMSWARADLLDWSSIQANFGVLHGDSKPLFSDYRDLDCGDSMPSEAWACSRMFSIVIEKSCADAIACGEDISIPVPYKLNRIVDQTKTIDDETMYIHPVCLLAIHLAAMTKPAGFWIALSYSETRFDCLAGERAGDQYSCRSKKVGNESDPSQLWAVISKQEIIFQAARKDGNVYRPKIAHWLYILRRTDTAVV